MPSARLTLIGRRASCRSRRTRTASFAADPPALCSALSAMRRMLAPGSAGGEGVGVELKVFGPVGVPVGVVVATGPDVRGEVRPAAAEGRHECGVTGHEPIFVPV